MGLSSNILWHQTKKSNLINILRLKNFLFSYSKERFIKTNIEIAFPMISFCDLPLSEFAGYIGKYGGYSIGMSREWGRINRFNPVWYCESNSLIEHQLSDLLLKHIVNKKIRDVSLLLELNAYIKPVEGELNVKGHRYSNYRFMDEREVRLVPDFKVLNKNKLKFILTQEQYIKYKNTNKNNSTLPLGIPFDWKDIKYIVVQNEANIDEFKKILAILGCDNNKISIFHQQQVKEDFIGIEHDIEKGDNNTTNKKYRSVK